ncbi:MAG TPA: alkaline phosphatase family protein, partial [Thermoanaerobaculia bacterium]|nr:alkaline phosphatase family protein [Thermoanaerobaculia bacterium]
MATNPGIKNVVVLMFENRSYDNVLGAFFNGITASLSNLDPKTNQPIAVWGSASDATTIPSTDPGEVFDDMAQQFLGLEDIAPDPKSVWPSSGPLTPGPYGLMGGFVANYAMQKGNTANLADVMHYYVPALMPVTNYLAQTFMVCDSWFASVPSQTFVNRLFLSAAAPGYDPLTHASFVNDTDYLLSWGLGGQDLPTVFQMLDAADSASPGPNWKLY